MSMANMKRLVSLAIFLAPLLAYATEPPPTFENLMRHGKESNANNRYEAAVADFQQAVALTKDPGRKAQAFGEAAANALSIQWLRVSAESSCQALKLVEGPARASHLFNLGRVAEEVHATPDAVAIYAASLALRPNAIVAARLKKLKPPLAALTTADPAAAFCTAALKPSAAFPADFAVLATQIAKSRSETVKYLQQRALGPRGELYPVAFLCGQSDGMGAWIIQTDMAHRYLVAFDVPGSELDACQKEDTRTPIFIGSGRHNALRFYMGHRGGYDDYRVAVRGGRPVVIWHESLNDNRAGDVPVVRDFDKHGRDFEDANSMMPGKMKLVLLDARGTEQREDQNR